jgi:hypothetical protein
VADRGGELERPCRVCGARSGLRTPTGWVCAVCGWRVGEYVDPDLPLPRIHVVYYLRLDERVKIGTTVNPRQRFAALRVGVAGAEELLAFEPGDRTVERRRHVEFADDRLGTSEWFALSPALHAHIEALADGHDPWHVHARWLAEALARR